MGKYKWLLLLLILAIVARWGSFFISVINHDESTYIVIADEMLRGEVYLRDLFDTKPIGIFWIYAGLIKITGGSIIALRAAAAFVVGLGGWGLYLAGLQATGSERVGGAAGVIYVLICSLFTYYGVSPNTEIFFNAFTIGAVALAVAPRIREGGADPLWHWPAAGVLLGLAVIIKPFAAAEALAVGLFMVWFYGRRWAVGRAIGSGLLLLGFFTLPLLFVYGYYYRLGLLEELSFFTLDVSAAYPVDLPWYLRLKYMGDYLLRFSPLVILGAGALVQCRNFKRREGTSWGYYLLLQFVLVTAVVLLTGKRFGHYQVQLHPVIALLAALWWLPGLTVFPWLRNNRFLPRPAYFAAGLALLLGIAHYFNYAGKKDHPQQIATYLQGRLGPEETYFLLNGNQVTYHLLDRSVPTPYVHSSLLFLDHHVRAFQVDERAEAERIINNPNVVYLIGEKHDQEIKGVLGTRLLEVFEVADEFGDNLVAYRRR